MKKFWQLLPEWPSGQGKGQLQSQFTTLELFYSRDLILQILLLILSEFKRITQLIIKEN